MAYFLRFDGVDDVVNLASPIGIFQTSNYQIDWEIAIRGVPLSDSYLTGQGTGFQSSITFEPDGDLSIRFTNEGSRLTWNVGLSMYDGERHTFSLRRTGNTHELFFDGVSQGQYTQSTIGNRGITVLGATGGDANGKLNLYSLEFYDAVGGSLLNNYDPSASFDQGELVDTAGSNNGTPIGFPTNFNDALIFYDDGGGAVDYTITLDSGNYSLTGNTLSLLSDRNISLENGSYSLTGVDLNLAVQRFLSLSQGIYSSQGTNTTLVLERLLGLDTGAYTKVGNPLELLANRAIPLEQGSYSYLGSDINLQYGREFRLSLEQGTYSLQGTEIGLLKDYILPLGTDSYSYTPENISLLASRKITTESGSYSYTGSPINFIYEAGGITYTLSLDSGDYSLTGQPLNLYANRRLPIDFGEYTYEGVDSDLLYNRVVALDSGIYTSSGTDTGLRVNRRLVFQNGNYSLQGTPITLSYTGEVLAILEGYRLSYKKHPVKQIKYKPYNITARYN